ncbi:MAG TPA: alpha/beta hydrolase [Pseudonocardiaceae bacterium]|jgi:pimeloyl-ACP methyl ester carboxylesterase|nr:alpha/beta hydrolase [Pseudonocardiaceae bacterium]
MSSLPTGVRETDVTTSRLRAHVLESGPADAPVLVLVHGNVSAARFFAETMAGLGERWHCLAIDLRGFGGSQALPVDATRGVADFADDVHAVLTESGLVPVGRRVHLLGWSLGGGVVLRYAIDHPGAVAGIVLESAMSPFGFGGTKDLAGTPSSPEYAGSGGGTANPEMVRRITEGDRGVEDGTSPRRVLTTLYGNPPYELAPAVEDALVDGMLMMAIGPDNYPGDSVEAADWPGTGPGERGVNNAIAPKYCDLSGFAEVTDRPDVLWIRGDADQIVSDTSLVDLGYLGQLGAVPGWPGEEVFPPQPMVGQLRAVLESYRAAGGHYTEHVLPGCGHSPHLERPAEFGTLVTAFLAGLDAVRGSSGLAS